MVQDLEWVRLLHVYLGERTARRDLCALTVRQHRYTLVAFIACIEHGGTVDRDVVVRWLDACRSMQPGTLRTSMGRVRTFTSWLYMVGAIVADPMVEFNAPRVPKAVPRALGPDELQLLWDVLPDSRARLIVALGVGLGLRRAEIAGLELGDWDRYNQVLTVRHDTKGGNQRLLPVPDHVARRIESYLRDRPRGAGRLIRSQVTPASGINADRIGRMMTAWMLEAGVKEAPWDGRSTHALRHSFAQMLYRQGGDPDLRLVQHALGHAHLSSTEVYMRAAVDTERLRLAMANVDIGGLPPTAA